MYFKNLSKSFMECKTYFSYHTMGFYHGVTFHKPKSSNRGLITLETSFMNFGLGTSQWKSLAVRFHICDGVLYLTVALTSKKDMFLLSVSLLCI